MATLNTTISEEISIDGKVKGNTITNSVTSVATYSQFTMEIGNSYTDLFLFSTSQAAGTYVATDVKYIRVTLNDSDSPSSADIQINTANYSHSVKINDGESFVIRVASASDGTNATEDLTSIRIKSSASGTVDCFIACS